FIMTSEKPTSNLAASSQEDAPETPPSVDKTDPLENRVSDNSSTQPATSSDSKATLKPFPRASPQNSTPAAQSAKSADPVTAPKPIADKTLTSAPSELPQPSSPVSMIVRPHSVASANSPGLFPGELEESFESALSRIEGHAGNSLAARILGSLRLLL